VKMPSLSTEEPQRRKAPSNHLFRIVSGFGAENYYHILSCLILLVLFRLGSESVFFGYDGKFFRQKFLHWLTDGHPRLFLTYDAFQGFGDLEFPINFWFSIPALATRFFFQYGVSEVVYYYFASVLTYFLVALLLRSARFRPIASSILAVFFTGLILNYFKPFTLWPIFGITPWSLEVMVFSSAMAALVVPIFDPQSRPTQRILSVVAFWLLAIVVSMLWPTRFYISMPMVAVVVLIFTVKFGRTTWKIAPRALAVFVSLGVIFGLIFGPFLLGIAADTAYNIFTEELVAPRDEWIFFSTLFLGLRFLQDNPLDPNAAFYILSVVGCFWTAKTLDGPSRYLYFAVLICLVMLNFLGLFAVLSSNYNGVSAIYFEFHLWPLMFVAAVIGLRDIVRYVLERIRTLKLVSEPPATSHQSWGMFASVAVLAPILVVAVARPLLTKNRFPFPEITKATEIVSDLEVRLATSASKPLAGRLLNIAGTATRKADGSLNWEDVVSNDGAYLREFGNELRTYGLWGHGIPTVLQYNQIMSPAYYYIATRAFAEPRDQRIRSLLMMSRADPKWLRIMGVRYVLSETPLEVPGLRMIKSYPVAATPSHPLRLYEVEGWRPFSLLPDATESLLPEEMKSETDHGVAPDAATEAQVKIEDSGIKIDKRTTTPILMALPIMYSHCFSVLEPSDKGNVNLFPAYGSILGISLSKPGKYWLQYRNGPFDNPWCRLSDWWDARKMFQKEPLWFADDKLRHN